MLHVHVCLIASHNGYAIDSNSSEDAVAATNASRALASELAPLYGPYCMCRVQMSCMEEHYIAKQEEELDEIREEISAVGLEEEMASAASLGRLNVYGSMTTLSGMFQQDMP